MKSLLQMLILDQVQVGEQLSKVVKTHNLRMLLAKSEFTQELENLKLLEAEY